MANMINNHYYGKILLVVLTTTWMIVSTVIVSQSINNRKELNKADIKITATINNINTIVDSLHGKIEEINITAITAKHAEDIANLKDNVTKVIVYEQDTNKSIASVNKTIDIKINNTYGNILGRSTARWGKLGEYTGNLITKLNNIEDLLQQQNITHFEKTKFKCPNDSVKLHNRCFSYHDQYEDWQGANNVCLNKGGFMPEFVKNDFSLSELMVTFPLIKSKSSGTYVVIWLNAKDDAVEGQWKWGSGEELRLTDYRWANNQPNDLKTGQDCLAVAFDNRELDGLEDHTCDLKGFPHVRNFIQILCEHIPQITNK